MRQKPSREWPFTRCAVSGRQITSTDRTPERTPGPITSFVTGPGKCSNTLYINDLPHRDDRIRTCDPLNPIQVRYRAALRPVTASHRSGNRHQQTSNLTQRTLRFNHTPRILQIQHANHACLANRSATTPS